MRLEILGTVMAAGKKVVIASWTWEVRSRNVRFKVKSLHMHKDKSRATETGTLW